MQAVWEPWGTGVYQNFRETSVAALTCQNDSIHLPTFRSDRKKETCMLPLSQGQILALHNNVLSALGVSQKSGDVI